VCVLCFTLLNQKVQDDGEFLSKDIHRRFEQLEKMQIHPLLRLLLWDQDLDRTANSTDRHHSLSLSVDSFDRLLSLLYLHKHHEVVCRVLGQSALLLHSGLSLFPHGFLHLLSNQIQMDFHLKI